MWNQKRCNVGSDGILLARSRETALLQLRYLHESSEKGKQTVSIRVAGDYDCIAGDAGVTIHDYLLRRVLFLTADRRLTNCSLYAEAWYRLSELQNRLKISASLKRARVDYEHRSAHQERFWDEAELALLAPAAAEGAASVR